MTRADVADPAAMLFAAFPQARPQPETVQVYERMLMDLERPALEGAIVRLLATARFTPTIGEVRDLATRTDGEPLALEAWGLVVDASRKRVGRVVDRFG